MLHHKRTKLYFGPHRTPRFKRGLIVFDESRGDVRIVGLSDAPIPWPLGVSRTGAKALVLYKDLAQAVRKESNKAIQYWWKIGMAPVTRWRKALSVNRYNRGTTLLQKANGHLPYMARIQRKSRTKEALRKRGIAVAAYKVGKPRPPRVLRALLKARHRPQSAEHRRKISLANKGRYMRGLVPKPWAQWEDALLLLPMQDVIAKTGRTRYAIQLRRRKLVPSPATRFI